KLDHRRVWASIRRLAASPEGRVACILTVLLLVAIVPIELAPAVFGARRHLGAEYYSIALALNDGRGFSDPFGEPTGPTAWMPPLYPVFMAVLQRILGNKGDVAWTVVLLMNASVVVVGVTVYHLMRRL